MVEPTIRVPAAVPAPTPVTNFMDLPSEVPATVPTPTPPVTNFMDLPSVVVEEILARLPPEKILELREVSLKWGSIISSKGLYDEHLRRYREPDTVSLLVFSNTQDSYYVNYDDNEGGLSVGTINSKLPMFHDSILPVNIKVVGSCNGLVCIHAVDTLAHHIVLNPLTRIYRMLPSVPGHYITHNHLSTGFGYLPSTGQYKIVSLYQSKVGDGEVKIFVYTIGSADWICVQTLTIPHLQFDHDNVVFANGALHWVNMRAGENEGQIMVFSLATDSIVIFLPPPDLPEDVPLNHHALGVLNGAIYFAVREDLESDNYLIWQPKNTLDYLSMLGGEVFEWEERYRICSKNLLAVTLNGSVVCSIGTSLFLFEPGTSSSTTTLLQSFNGLSFAIPHTNTLVSLKRLGEFYFGPMEDKTEYEGKRPRVRTRTVDSISRKRRREQGGSLVRRVIARITGYFRS